MPIAPFVTVDVGNSRIKVGLFATGTRGGELPEPLQAIELPAETFDTQALGVWLSEATRRVSATPAWWVASVNREPTERLLDWLKEQGGVEFHPGTLSSWNCRGVCRLGWYLQLARLACSCPGCIFRFDLVVAASARLAISSTGRI